VLTAVALLTAALTPVLLDLIGDTRASTAQADVERIAQAVAGVYEDTGQWPQTNADGPSGAVDRLVTSDNVVTGAGPGAGSGAANWGALGTAKHLGDFVYWNNPDDDTSVSGAHASEMAQDYAISGRFAWRGPYLGSYELNDPWGNAYVINARYLPGGAYRGPVPHRVLVLSAGPDEQWQTPFFDGITEEVMGDDIGVVIAVR
jgi:hypothetical protein